MELGHVKEQKVLFNALNHDPDIPMNIANSVNAVLNK
jgi:hypothetical protein